MLAKDSVEVETELNITPVRYDVTLAVIGELKEKYKDLKIIPGDKESYEANRVALGVVRPLRTAVDPKRKEMNAKAQAYIKKVNDEGKEIIRLLKEVEDPLKADKDKEDDRLQAIEDEKIRAKQVQVDAVEAIRELARNISPLMVSSEIKNIMAKALGLEITEELYGEYLEDANRAGDRVYRELEVILETRLEVEKADAERKVEDERLAKERKEIEAKAKEMQDRQDAIDAENKRKLEEQRKAQAEAQAKIDAQQKELADREAKIKAEEERKEREEFEARLKEEAQEEAKEYAKKILEKQVRDAEEKAKADKVESVRQENLKPDKEKLEAFAARAADFAYGELPEIQSKEGRVILAVFIGQFDKLVIDFKSDIKNL